MNTTPKMGKTTRAVVKGAKSGVPLVIDTAMTSQITPKTPR